MESLTRKPGPKRLNALWLGVREIHGETSAFNAIEALSENADSPSGAAVIVDQCTGSASQQRWVGGDLIRRDVPKMRILFRLNGLLVALAIVSPQLLPRPMSCSVASPDPFD